jgi:hypothetical protein
MFTVPTCRRDVLFSLINSNPTIYEVVSGRAKATAAQPGKRRSSSAGPRPAQRQRVSTAVAYEAWGLLQSSV